jgi:hypothetical protein
MDADTGETNIRLVFLFIYLRPIKRRSQDPVSHKAEAIIELEIMREVN